jgi:hypothetical protein
VALQNEGLAWKDRLAALKFARTSNAIHNIVGIAAIVAGVAAGTAAIAEAEPLLTGIAAFLASALTAVQTFLKPLANAHHHWKRGAGLLALSKQWETLGNAPEEPTREQFDALITRWEQLHQSEL